MLIYSNSSPQGIPKPSPHRESQVHLHIVWFATKRVALVFIGLACQRTWLDSPVFFYLFVSLFLSAHSFQGTVLSGTVFGLDISNTSLCLISGFLARSLE